jgi:replication fork protection complex subunit Csm3/Swi3
MASLDEIWDAPVSSTSPKAPRQLDLDDDDALLEPPAKRQRQALFLSDSEDDDQPGASVPRGATRAPPRVVNPLVDEDVEALFADAENDEQLSFKRIGDLDIAAMEKEAEERHRRAMPLTPHPVMPSSSPARDGEATATSGTKGKEKEPIKRRKPLVLNENLLLGPTGFPDLISQLKDFKVKGKGHEVCPFADVVCATDRT